MQSICFYLLLLGLVEVIAKEDNVLNGRNLKMAAENWPPFFMIYEHPEYPGYSMYFGVMEKLLEGLRGALNFSTTVVRPPDGSWGNYDPETRQWSGMVGMVYRNEVDFALGPFALIWDRAQIVDFTTPVYTDPLVCLVPLKMEKVPDVLIKPFDWRVWIVLIALPPMYLLIIAISEYVFNRHVDWWTLIYLTLMPIFMQGVPRLPETKIYNRIFSINWIMPMYVLGLAYLGVMTSMISSPKEPEYVMDPHNVATAKELYQKDIPWIVESGSSLENFGFDQEEGSEQRMFYDRKIVVKGLTNITNMVKTGEFAWFDNKLSLQSFISDEFGRNGMCNFYLTASIVTTNFAMIFPKGSAYFEPINAKLHSMFESGLIDTWISDLVANFSNCDNKAKILASHERPHLVHLTLAEMQRFFTIIILGLIASVAVFLAEVIVKAKLDHTKKLGQMRKERMRIAVPSSKTRETTQ